MTDAHPVGAVRVHGTYATYITCKCRCDLCVKACSDYRRQWRRKRGLTSILTEYERWHLTGKSGDFL